MSDSLQGKRVLILGGLGFIGSNLAISLVESDAVVTIVDSMLPQYGGNLANIEPIRKKCNVNYADIRDQHSMDYLVRDIDIIYSLAGQTSHIESMSDPMTDLDINCRSQLALLQSCQRYNSDVKIVYASTRQIYGRPQYLPVDEDHAIVPVDVNGVNKFAAEMYYTLYSQVYDMHCISLRLTNTYGPRQHLDGDAQGFAGIFIRKAISGETIKVFGTGDQLRDFNYVDDVVDALRLAAESPVLKGQVFNLGAYDHYSLLDFIATLQQYCKFDYEVIPFPPEHRVIDIGDYYGDFARFHEATGWEPKISLTEGLRRSIEYFEPRASLYWDSQ